MRTLALQLGAIGLGAVLGAWARWTLSLWLPAWHGVPLGTLAANLIGGYAIGVAVACFAAAPGMAPEWRLFVVTGLLGALTTFSSFSIEVIALLERQQFAGAALAVTTHVLGSLMATALGLATVRAVRALVGQA